jgi:ribosomal protein S18 acetylase RimI-like enzyme
MDDSGDSHTGEVNYRVGGIEDCESIASLGARVFTHSFASLMPESDLRKYLSDAFSISSIAADLKDPTMTFIVATKGSSVVGFLQLTAGTSEACIDDLIRKIQLQRLYVSSDLQGKGTGRKLMDMAEEEAKSRGVEYLWLASWEANPRVTRMYEKAGYKIVGDMKFMLGGLALKDWVMVKRL